MPSEKRLRQKEGQRARLEAARAEAMRRQRRRQIVSAIAFVGVVVAIIAVSILVTNRSDDTTSTADSTTTTTVAGAAASFGTGDCPPATKPTSVPKTFSAAPKNCLTDGATYKAVITTNLGVIKVDLASKTAPVTVNNFVALARWGWFDGEGFHRVVAGFVDQAGNAAGRGNPGYKIPDELPASLSNYTKGTLAMANAGANTGGSQWFICIDCSKLPGPAYPIFGQVTEGFDAVDAINALADGDGPPTKPVTISTVEIIQS